MIEQCEAGDDVPAGWSRNPLRLTVDPDPDAGFDTRPAYVYVHAGRAGLMEVFIRRARNGAYETFRCALLDAARAEQLGDVANATLRAETVLDLC